MRAVSAFLLLFLVAFVVVVLLAYPAWLLLVQFGDVKFHRAGVRLGEVVLAIGLIVIARRLGVGNRTSLGFALAPRHFIAESTLGLTLGIATMLPPAVLFVLTGMRDVNAGITAAVLAGAIFGGLVTGLAVALIEETFMRGAMFSAVRRESGLALAAVSTAMLYAATHFFGRVRIPADEVDWLSGLHLLASTLRAFADPLAIADAFICLTAVGLILALVREVTGNIAACIGLHAGWVAMITATRTLTTVDAQNPAAAALLSPYDGFTGWLVFAWSLVIAPALYLFYRRRAAHRCP